MIDWAVASSISAPRARSSPATRSNRGRPATRCKSLAPASRAAASAPSRDEIAATCRACCGFTTAARSSGSDTRAVGSSGSDRCTAGALAGGTGAGSMGSANGLSAAGVGAACAAEAAGAVPLFKSANLAWTRPSRITACTATGPSPSTRVVQAAGLSPSSSTYRLPPTDTSIARMASVVRAASSTGSYLPSTFTQGSRSLTTANSVTSGRPSSRSICWRLFIGRRAGKPYDHPTSACFCLAQTCTRAPFVAPAPLGSCAPPPRETMPPSCPRP